VQTDEMVRIPRPQRETAVAKALQQLTPLSCSIVDARDKPVPLSSAGYVLRFGHSYRLQVVPPFSDEEIDRVRLVNVPDFIAHNDELREPDEDGQSVRSIPFRVSPGWSYLLWRAGLDVRTDTLDVTYKFPKGREKEVRLYRCPVVVRRRWGVGVVVAALITAIGSMLYHVLYEMVLNGRLPDGGLIGLGLRVARSPYSWLSLIGLALLVLAGGFLTQCYMVHKRSRKLKRMFRDKYPDVC
jgi:hypothetical protein